VQKIKSDPVLMYTETPFSIDLEVTSELKALKGVILTMNNEDSVIKKAMGNGADGYLLKKADWEESYNAPYSVRKGNRNFSVEVTKRGLHAKKFKTSSLLIDNDTAQLFKLKERKIDILKQMEEGFYNKEIWEKLPTFHCIVNTQ
jgi:DNA-binding NarL/FixJ family response regulator